MVKTEFPITNQFLEIKQMSKTDDCDLEVFDGLCSKLLVDLARLTEDGMSGDDEIEGVKLDLWKDRVWHLLEKMKILPEYKGEDIVDIFTENTDDDGWLEILEDMDDDNVTDSFDPSFGF